MDFLDARRLAAGNDEAEITPAGEGSAAGAGHPQDCEPPRASRLDRGEHVRRAPARRQNDQKISPFPQSFDLASENAREAVVISNGGENGGIGRQREGGQRPSVPLVSSHELRGKVLGLRRASAVAAKKDRPATPRGRGESLGHSLDERLVPPQGLEQEARALREADPDGTSGQAASPPAPALRDAR